MNLWLAAGLACLVAWVVLTFVAPVGAGAVHILLGVGLSALVIWWGTRGGPQPSP